MTQNRDGALTSYTYNNRDQLLQEDSPNGQVSYTYDSAGRQSSKTDNSGTTTYGWIDSDRLSTVSGPGVTVSYEYDAEGRRVKTSDGVSEKNYLIDVSLPYGQVIAETGGDGSLTVEYVYGLERISQTRNGAVSYYAADGQGSVRELTDAAGGVTDKYWYTAFGEELARTGATENEFRYVGEQWDPNAGFYYLRARWMDPARGRFVSVDPWAGDPQSPVSLHRYLYANGSPIEYTDPSGNYSIVTVMSTIAVSGVLAAIVVPRIFDYFQVPRDIFLDFSKVLTAKGKDKVEMMATVIGIVQNDFSPWNVRISVTKPSVKKFKHLIYLDYGFEDRLGIAPGFAAGNAYRQNECYVFVASINESFSTKDKSDIFIQIGNTSSHELGHTYGLPDGNSGIMSQGEKTNPNMSWSAKDTEQLNRVFGVK